MEPSRPGEVFAVIAMVHHMAIRRKALRPPVDGFFAAGYAAGKQSSSQMPYEAGTQIVFDLVDRTVVVSFRDTVKMLGPYADRKEAIRWRTVLPQPRVGRLSITSARFAPSVGRRRLDQWSRPALGGVVI